LILSHRRLTSEEKYALRPIFDSRPEKACLDCGGYHLRACPRIKREVHLGNGNRTEVEYWPQWDDSEVIYPEDVLDDDQEEPDE
jgi:hypothetical protein